MIHTRVITPIAELPRVRHSGRPGEPLRIVVRLEPEADDTPALGYYVEARRDGHWLNVSEGICESADAAMENIRAVERAAQSLDSGIVQWAAELGANLE